MSGQNSSYLCPYCGVRVDEFEDLRAHVINQHSGEPAPRPEGLIELTINGQEYRVQVEPEWTLNHLLHDRLGLTSPKMFCDRGACGSCTVILDGRPILSCLTLAIECDRREVQTAEGIADAGHPLVESYIKHHCLQCGYCTPGFITTAKALLDRNPDPSEEEIREALGGNLCRCGTYPQHPPAIQEAARELRKKKAGEKGAGES